MNSSFTAEQRIARTRVALLRDPKWAYLTGIFMVGKSTVEDDVPTAYTNGRDIKYGRKLVDSLPDAQLRGVVLHETSHIMFRHLSVWLPLYKKDAELANIACDHVINLLIKDAGEELPDWVACDERFRNMDAQKIFYILQAEKKAGGGSGRIPHKASGTPGRKVGDPLDDHGWEEAQQFTPEELKEMAKEIDQALREGAIIASRTGQNIPRAVGELTAPKVDWRETLREFIKTTVKGNSYATWRRPSRRHMWNDTYLPSAISESAGHMVLGSDTSGSISDKESAAYLSEINAICNDVVPERIDLLYWGHVVAVHETYEGAQLADLVGSTRPRGGGGTEPQCVADYIKQKAWTPQCIVMLTDGEFYETEGMWDQPIIWVCTTKRVMQSGITIHIELDR